MPTLYLSLPSWPKVPSDPISISSNSLRKIFDEIGSTYRLNGINSSLINDLGYIKSSVAFYTNIQIIDGRFYDTDQTRRVVKADAIVCEEDGPLLLSVFNADTVFKDLLDLLSENVPDKNAQVSPIESQGFNRSYQPHLSRSDMERQGRPLVIQSKPEPIYGFTLGQPLEKFCATGSSSLIEESPLLSNALAQGIANVISNLEGGHPYAWSDLGSVRLRLFQEELMRAMVAELSDALSPRPLLLNVPTGGGKTGAFLFGLLASLEKLADGEDNYWGIMSVR